MTPIKDIKWTCPDIDAAKSIVEGVQKEVKSALKWLDEQYASRVIVKDSLECIERELYYLPDTLENLRTSNSELREAATDLQEEVDSMREEIGTLKDQIEDLESDVEALESEVEAER